MHFNVCSLTGSDPCPFCGSTRIDIISIHAPSPGATPEIVKSYFAKLFQSTLPHRERQMGKDTRNKGFKFQSTLPHRERQQNPLIFLPFPSLFLRNYTVSILTIQSHSAKPPHNFPSYFPIPSANPSGDLWVLGIRTGAFRVCVFRQNAVPYRWPYVPAYANGFPGNRSSFADRGLFSVSS